MLTPGKYIATPEELTLLVDVYIGRGLADRAVDLLQSPPFLATSALGKLDPQTRTALLVRALRHAQRWDTAFVVCKDLLQSPDTAMDGRIWKLLLDSVWCSSSRR